MIDVVGIVGVFFALFVDVMPRGWQPPPKPEVWPISQRDVA